MPAITAITAEPMNVALTEPFGIATGTQALAENVLVTLELDDGSVGLGEAAPFPAVSGETQAQTLAALDTLGSALVGQAACRWRRIAALAREAASDAPAARAAIEMALLDALTRRAGLPLWSFFGGAEQTLSTDITITTGDVEHARRAAARARAAGYRLLKIKVGAGEVGADVERISAIAAAAPDCPFSLDANAALSADDSLELVRRLGPLASRLVLFEQPAPRGDHAGARRVREEAGVRVAADESAKTARDVAELARAGAADVVNLKIMKSGVAEALDMALAARALGLELMIGGMVETELAMTVSACLAAGLGGFSFVDLDTPVFMAERPLAGGMCVAGPELSLGEISAGHGVFRRSFDKLGR